jgi:hypothetical protein
MSVLLNFSCFSSSYFSTQVKAHSFFSTVDWVIDDKSAITPQFVPHAKGADDTSYFDPERKFSMTRLTFMETRETQQIQDEVGFLLRK